MEIVIIEYAIAPRATPAASHKQLLDLTGEIVTLSCTAIRTHGHPIIREGPIRLKDDVFRIEYGYACADQNLSQSLVANEGTVPHHRHIS